MEQEFLKEKALWINKMKHGDMTEGARIAGIKKSAFQEWLVSKEVKNHETESRNLKAIKEAVRKRENELREAIAA